MSKIDRGPDHDAMPEAPASWRYYDGTEVDAKVAAYRFNRWHDMCDRAEAAEAENERLRALLSRCGGVDHEDWRQLCADLDATGAEVDRLRRKLLEATK